MNLPYNEFTGYRTKVPTMHLKSVETVVQGVPKGTDTFQSFIIKNLHITKTSIKCHFFNKFGKTGNPSFNG